MRALLTPVPRPQRAAVTSAWVRRRWSEKALEFSWNRAGALLEKADSVARIGRLGWTMEFRILGPVEIWDGVRRLDLGGAKPRAVLAALLVHASQVVSTHRPIDELWGEAPPPTARNVLQCHVSRLRRALHHSHDRGAPAQILSTQQHGYLLRVEPGQLDLHRFEELLAQARSASAEQDYEQARPGSCEPDGPGGRFGNSHPGPDIYTV